MSRGVWIRFFLVLGLLVGCLALAINVKPNLGLDLKGGAQFVFEAEGTDQTPANAENVDKTLQVLRGRVDALGVAESTLVRQGENRILVELPGIQDPAQAKRVLSSTATLEFHLVDTENDPYEAQRRGRAPLGSELHTFRETGQPILLRRDVIASGDQLVDATQGYDENGSPAVNVRLDAAGARKMLDTTINNIGKPMAVLFIQTKPGPMIERDGQQVPGDTVRTEEVINSATIQGVFGSNFQITGLQQSEARELALLLRAGSLAAPLYIVEQRTTGPSLGQDNIDRGVRALVIGMVATWLWMVMYWPVSDARWKASMTSSTWNARSPLARCGRLLRMAWAI